MKICLTPSRAVPEISYSGLTYISICSGKHNSSTAYSNGCDFDHVLQVEQLQSVAKQDCNAKSVAMVFSDGAPNEITCFPKTLDVAIQHFKKYKLNALLISTHPPDMSTNNQVEQRMDPLSKALVGLVFPYDTFGKHLDFQRKLKEN